jgi:polyhydroxyalkanoate synthesis repressor PhaR
LTNNKKDIRIIKKYQNRRLYDTAISMYIVLSDVRDYIVEGEIVKVIDVKTEQDVTRSVLLQIVLEEEVSGAPMFSDDFLFQIIKFYGKALQPSVSPFLENGLDLFRKMQKQFYEQLNGNYTGANVTAGIDLWNDFLSKRNSQVESSIKDYIENSTDTFLKMQEKLKDQTESMLNYMPFPFSKKKSEK